MQTSVITVIFGKYFFISLTAAGTIPVPLYAPLPVSSFSDSSGVPNKSTLSTPYFKIPGISFTSISGENLFIPSKPFMASFIFLPGVTK